MVGQSRRRRIRRNSAALFSLFFLLWPNIASSSKSSGTSSGLRGSVRDALGDSWGELDCVLYAQHGKQDDGGLIQETHVVCMLLDGTIYQLPNCVLNQSILEPTQVSLTNVTLFNDTATLDCTNDTQATFAPISSRNDSTSTSIANVTLVYVETLDANPTFSRQTLQDKFFGGPNDLVNPASIMRDCSFGQFILQPHGPVVSVTLDINLSDGYNIYTMENLVTHQLQDDDNVNNETLVVYCFPPGVLWDTAWGSYGYVGATRTVCHDDRCLYPAFVLNGIGQSLGLLPSLDTITSNTTQYYGDGTCLMGGGPSDTVSDEGPRKCFNAAKSDWLGWYPRVTPAMLPYNTTLFGVNTDNVTVIRLGDYFLAYNDAHGINQGTQSHAGAVVIVNETHVVATIRDSVTRTSSSWQSPDGIVVEVCASLPPSGIILSIHDASSQYSQCMETPVISLGSSNSNTATAANVDWFDDSVLLSDPCPVGTFRLTLVLVTDFFPDETSWRLVRLDDGVVVRSVPATFYTGSHDTYQYSECWPEHFDYALDVLDTAEDGGPRFRIYRNEQEVRCGNGDFLAVDRTYLHAPCREGHYLVEVDIYTDWFGNETSFVIADYYSTQVNYTTTQLLPNMRNHVFGCFPSGCFRFVIFDAGGDGMCCDYGAGCWSIYYQDRMQVYSDFVGGDREEAVFGLACGAKQQTVSHHTGSGTMDTIRKQQQYQIHVALLQSNKKDPIYNNKKDPIYNNKKDPTYNN